MKKIILLFSIVIFFSLDQVLRRLLPEYWTEDADIDTDQEITNV